MGLGTEPRLRHVALVALLLVVACTRQVESTNDVPPDRDPFDSATAVASFDTVWRLIRDTHYDRALKGLDWNALGAELRPRVVRAQTIAQVRTTLTELLSRLGDSHYSIIPREALPSADPSGSSPEVSYGDLGMDLRLLDGAITVTRLDTGGAAFAAGVRSGWIVESVDSFPVASVVSGARKLTGAKGRVAAIQAALAVSRRFGGASGTSVRVTMRDTADRLVDLTVERREAEGDVVRLGNLPLILARMDTARVLEPGGCVGVIRFTSWMPVLANRIERAVGAFGDCLGMVVDVRGNLGGVAAMVMGTSGWFLPTADTLGILRLRDAELRYVAIPHRVTADGRHTRPFDGALALLVDAHSEIGRAHV